jgi:hypothetical protein
LPDGTSDFLFIGTTQFVENNPMHSRTVVDFPTENVGDLAGLAPNGFQTS